MRPMRCVDCPGEWLSFWIDAELWECPRCGRIYTAADLAREDVR